MLLPRPDTIVVEGSAPDATGVLRAVLRRARSGELHSPPLPLYLRPPDVSLSTPRPRGRPVSRRLEAVSEVMAGPLSMLHRACFPEDPWSSLAIAEIMSITGCFGRIAWADEMPAGFALALDLRKECEILALGVLSERRREGIGSALLDSVCSEGRIRGAECIVLEVAVDNSAALALYTARGFTAGRPSPELLSAGESLHRCPCAAAHVRRRNDPAISSVRLALSSRRVINRDRLFLRAPARFEEIGY